MLAIIMAGGEGARLRPLTCDRPKPMAPLAGKPVMEYALSLLRKHHVEKAAVTLKYLPENIRAYFGDGRRFGMELSYYVEKEALGTAGGVAQARDFLTETFVVLSGDGITDCDLTRALESHKASGAKATIVLTRVEEPLEYGVVCVDDQGCVKRFVEKPEWSQVTGDLVNTGIYILEPAVLDMIPREGSYDFGKDLFPKLLSSGEKIHTFLWEGYWCDIGDIAAYRRACCDLLSGAVHLSAAPRPNTIVRMSGARIDASARLEAPCYIGRNVYIGPRAHIGAYTILEDGCAIGAGSSVKRSVLWKGVRIGENCEVRGSVIMENAGMEAECRAFEGSVLGSGSVAGERSLLRPDCRIWPGKRLPGDTEWTGRLVWGGSEALRFQEGALCIQEPAQAFSVMQAWCAAADPASVLLSRDASAASQACYLSALSALLAQGVQVYEAGKCTIPEARRALWNFGADGAAHISFEHGIRLWNGDGVEPGGGIRRSLLNHLRRGDGERPFTRIMHPPVSAGRCDLSYLGWVTQDREHIRQANAAVYCADAQLLSLAERAFEKAGCQVRAEWEEEMMEMAPGEIGVWLEENGESVRFLDENGMLTESESQLVPLWVQLADGCRQIPASQQCTRAAEDMARAFDGEILRLCGERSQWMRGLMEHSRDAFLCHFDGIYLALRFIDRLRREGLTLQQWRQNVPKVFRKSRVVRLDPAHRGRAMRALLESPAGAKLDEALSCHEERAWAWICPSDIRGECRVIGESYQYEAARELCDIYCAALQPQEKNGTGTAVPPSKE